MNLSLLAAALLFAAPDAGTPAAPSEKPAGKPLLGSAKISACSKALDGTPKLAEVAAKCAKHYSGMAEKSWSLLQDVPPEFQAVLLAQSIAREYCPRLKADKPEACDVPQIDRTMEIVSALNELNAAALKSSLGADDGAILARKMADAWKYLFQFPTGRLP